MVDSVVFKVNDMSRTYKPKDNPANWGGLSSKERERRTSVSWRRARHAEQQMLASDMRSKAWLDANTTTNGATGMRATVYGKVGFAKCR